jgi:hypothetical protein
VSQLSHRGIAERAAAAADGAASSIDTPGIAIMAFSDARTDDSSRCRPPSLAAARNLLTSVDDAKFANVD